VHLHIGSDHFFIFVSVLTIFLSELSEISLSN